MFGSNMMQRWSAHPWQQALATLAGSVVPGGSMLANLGFNSYNNRQFDNAAQASYANASAQGNRAAQAAFDKPLNGYMAGLSGSPYSGAGGGYTGAGGSLNGYNMAQQWGSQPASPFASGLLDWFGQGTLPGTWFTSGDPSQTGMPQSGGAVQARQDGGGGGGGFQGGFMGDGFTGMGAGGDVHGMVIRGVQPGLGSGQKWFHGRTPGGG